MHNIKSLFLLVFCLSFALTLGAQAPATTEEAKEVQVSKTQVNDVLEAGANRLQDNREAQVNVDKQAEQSQKLLDAYMEESKLLDSLNLYNGMLKKQLDAQDKSINTLNTSINNATVIERQILPLLNRMVESLEQFIAIDVPFLAEEREDRVEGLKVLLNSPQLTTSEKARRVFEAYQIENEFGYTIETYQDNVNVDGQTFAVEVLRIGRVALLFTDTAGNRYGFWNQQAGKWQALEESQFKRHITKGLRIAKEEMAPELITIPLIATREQR